MESLACCGQNGVWMMTWIDALGEERGTAACAGTWGWEGETRQKENLKLDGARTRSGQRSV